MIPLLFCALLQEATAPGEIRSHATIHSIGIEWDLAGDSNHTAACRVGFRKTGSEAWKDALPLFRVDYHGWYAETHGDRAYNMLAGSILFLDPDTSYDVRLELTDPDGGSASRTVTLRTRPVPALPAPARTFHVAPGEGEGDGSREMPFRGVKAAQATARPGDLFLLAAGEYGDVSFTAAKVAWKGMSGTVLSAADLVADQVWLEGMTFRKTGRDRALVGRGPVRDAVITRCTFLGYQYGIVVSREGFDWAILDNVIEGSEDPNRGDLSGEGVELNFSSGIVVAYNRISRVADGVSYPRRNCDIYNNDIFDVSDDGLEPDYGYANNRMWSNRLTNCKNAALSFQPMYCGPWYFIRNQAVGAGQIFKFRVQDRFVLANNTFVTWGHTSPYMHHVLTSFSRNNLYIMAGPREGRDPGPLWLAIYYKDSGRYCLPPLYAPDWRTDVDYDGFDWGDVKQPFSWEGGSRRFASIADFAAAVGIEKHGVRVRKEEVFEAYRVPGRPERLEPSDLLLKPGSNAIDAGIAVPNLVEDFAGRAPDLGAHEVGRPVERYGPRPLPPGRVDVFVSGQEGYHTFRIPSVIVTTKGTVLAFAEGRKKSRSDTGDIDLVLKRSTDGGRTWGPLQVVWDDGPNTCGNPCPVVDRDTGTIWLPLTHNLGIDTEKQIIEGTSKGTRTAWISKSDDDGRTWSAPVEITRDVKSAEATWYATGPGVSIQMKSGRLVVPCDIKYDGGRKSASHVMFSDDHGKTWQSGAPVRDHLSESQGVELADGSLLLNMRNYLSPRRERGIARSEDGGKTWSEPSWDPALVEPACQGSILRLSREPSRILFSNPASAKSRDHLTVRMSSDEGKTWPVAKLLYEGPAAYSCLTAFPDGGGCLYEAGEKNAYERIVFARFTLDWLSQ